MYNIQTNFIDWYLESVAPESGVTQFSTYNSYLTTMI